MPEKSPETPREPSQEKSPDQERRDKLFELMDEAEKAETTPEKTKILREMREVVEGKEEKWKNIEIAKDMEITKKDWQGMKGELEQFRKNKDWGAFAWQAVYMKILSPERVSELRLDEDDWQGMKKLLEVFRENHNWESFSFQAAKMKLLVPERRWELDLDGEVWKGMVDGNEGHRQMGSWELFFSQARNQEILRPTTSPSAKKFLEEQIWPHMKEHLEHYREDPQESHRWLKFSWLAQEARIIFPEKTSELNLDDEVWRGMKQTLEHYREEKNWGHFSEFAFNIKIMAAKEVKVTDKGLEIKD